MKHILFSALRDCGFHFNLREDLSLIYFGLSYSVGFAVCASNAPLWLIGLAAVNAVVSLVVLKSDIKE